ncbi:MAG: hypothetical protein AAF532_07860 [Planctomycetota bacterium]
MTPAAPSVDAEIASAITKHVRKTDRASATRGPFSTAAAALGAESALLAFTFPPAARAEAEMLLGRLSRGRGRRAVEAWAALRDAAARGPAAAVVAADLIRAAGRFSDPLVTLLAEELVAAVGAVAESAPSSADLEADPQVLTLAAELPLTLALTLPADLRPGGPTSRQAVEAARAVFRDTLEAATDADGTPHAALVPVLPAWLAVLVRATRRADAAGFDLWGKRRRRRLSELVAMVVSLTRRDGSAVLGDDASAVPVLAAGAAVCGWDGRQSEGRRLLSLAKLLDSDEPKPRIEPLVESDWGRLTSLATDDGPKADRVTLAYDRADVGFEVAFRGAPVVSGRSTLSARVRDVSPPQTNGRLPAGLSRNGHAANGDVATTHCRPEGPWDGVCSTGDVEGIYHELLNESGGMTFGRQVLLATDDRVVFVIDSAFLSGPDAEHRRVDLSVTWPLAGGPPSPASGSAPGVFLDAGKRRVGCYPVHVPQSPREAVKRPGNVVEADDGKLIMRASGIGAAVCVTAFDGSKGADGVVADWRKLTVAEDGRELPDRRAVGYRFRVGRRQWLLTRRFDGRAVMRTVLGLHHNSETVIGRVKRDGSIASYVTVE